MSKRRSRASGAMVSYAEVKNYLSQREIPQLFESLMAGLMYHRPENHIGYLQSCLDEVKSGSETRVQWSTFVNAKKRKSKEILPPLTPKKQDSFSSWSDNSRQSTPLPPISAKARSPPESKNTYILYHNPPPVLAKPQVPVLFVLGGPGAKTDELCEQVVARLRGLVHISICSMLKTRMTIEGFHRLTSVPACAVVDSVLQAMSMVKSAGALLVAGFPRNRGDIEEYRSRGVRMDGVVLVDFEEDALRRFLKHEISNSADVELELERYKQDIISVAEYYDNKDLLTVVMGDQDMEDIIEDLVLSVDRVIETRKNTEGFWDDDETGNTSRGRPSTVEIRDATEEDLASLQTESPKVKSLLRLDGNEKEGDITNDDDMLQGTNAEKSFDESESDETKARSEMERSTESKILEEDDRKERMEHTSPIIDATNVQKPGETAEGKQEVTIDDEFPIQRIPLLCALENLNLTDEEKIRDFIANELGMCFIDYCQLVLDDKTSNSVEGLRLLQNVLKQDEVSYSKGFFMYKFPFELLNVKDVEQILKLGYVSFISDETKGEIQELNLLLQSSLRDRIGLIFTTESKLEEELRRFLQDFKSVPNEDSLQSQESINSLELNKDTNSVEESNNVEETNDYIPNAVESETGEKDVHSKNNIDDDNALFENKSSKQSATDEDLHSEESDKESSKEIVTDSTKDEIVVGIHNENQQIHEVPGEVAASSEELKEEAASNEEIQIDEKSETSENGKTSKEEDTNEEERDVDDEAASGSEITPAVVKDDQSIKSDDLADENEIKQTCSADQVQNSEQEENDNKNSNGESEIDEGQQEIKGDESSASTEKNMYNQKLHEGNQTSSADQSGPPGQEKMPVEQEPSENQGDEDVSLDNKQTNGENGEFEVNAPASSESTPGKRKDSIPSEEESDEQTTENPTLEENQKLEEGVDNTDIINEPGEMTELATDMKEPPKAVVEDTVSEQEIPIKDSDIVSSINDESDAAKEQKMQMNSEEYAEKNEDHGSGDNELFGNMPVAESEESEQEIQRTENEGTTPPKIGDIDGKKEHERIEEDHESSVEEVDQSHETDTDVSTTSVVKSDVLDEDNDTTEKLNENAAPEKEKENPVVHERGSLAEGKEQEDEKVNGKDPEGEVPEQEQDLSEKLISFSNNNLDVEENITCAPENSDDNNVEKSENKDESGGKSHNLAGQEETGEKRDEPEGQDVYAGKSYEEEYESDEKCQELKGQEESGEKFHELEGQNDSEGGNHEQEGKAESADKSQELEGKDDPERGNNELEEKDESADKSHEVEGRDESNSIAEEVISEAKREENSECKSPSPSEKSLDVGEKNDEGVKENSQDQEDGNLNDKKLLPMPDAKSEVSETEIKADSEQDEGNVTVSTESEHLDDHDENEVNSQPDNQASDVIEATATGSEEQNQKAEESEKEESQNENSVATDNLPNVTPDQSVEGRDEEEKPIHSDAPVEDSKLIQREDDRKVSERTWKDTDKTAHDSFSAKRRNGSSRQKGADEDDAEEQERSSSSSRGEL